MKIAGFLPLHKQPGKGRPPESPDPVDRWDGHVAYNFGLGATRYFFSKLSTQAAVMLAGGLRGEAAVTLQRPFLAVVGFNGTLAHTRQLVSHLTEDGCNGGQVYYLKDGRAFLDEGLEQPVPADFKDPGARVFQLVPQHRQQNPEITADQIDDGLKTIARITGASNTDVAAHSMGGLGARIYRSRGGEGVGKLMMVGTPNQGIRAATMARWALDSGVGYALQLAGVAAHAGPALEWMQAIHDGNCRLSELNQRWLQDKQGLESVMVLGSTGRTTAQACPQEWGPGDGLVDSAALTLADTPVQLLPGTWTQGHISLMNDRQTFRNMTEFFGWTAR